MKNPVKYAAIGAAAVLFLAGGTAYAQDARDKTTTQSPRPGTEQQPPSPAQQPPSPGGTSKPSSSSGQSDTGLSSKDRSFVVEAVQGSMAEVQLGRLAAKKASSPEVKQFGQRMIDDHSKASEQLTTLAKQKNIELPKDMGKHGADYQELSTLEGPEFDVAYMKMMVNDHKKDVSEFRKASNNMKDPEIKSFASQTLPTLEEHLKMAQQANTSVQNETRGTSGKAPSKPATGDGSRPAPPPATAPPPTSAPEPGRPPSPDAPPTSR